MRKFLTLFAFCLGATMLIGCSGGDSSTNEKPLEGKVESKDMQSPPPGDSRPGTGAGESRDGDK